MANYIRLPNGAYYEAAEGQSYGDAVRAAYKQFPQAFGAPAAAPTQKTGLMADIGSSIENLANITRTGIGSLFGDTTAAAQAGAQREQAIGEKYEPTFQTEKITKPFEEGQYGTAALEAVKGVPGAMAQLAPSIAQEAGLALTGRIAGGALGALGGPAGVAVGQQVGQYALPLVVNAIQALGSQAQAKVQEQVKAGEKPDVDALELAPYAAANAAANLVGARIAMPSIFKKAIGQKVEAETADAARAALMKEAEAVAGRGTLKTIGMGVGKFAVGELPTEIFQDVVDRAAIGKPLADDEAFAQYRSTALGMVLGSPLGGGFGVYERAGARTAVAKQQEQDARKAAAEAEAAKNAPEALAKLDNDFRAAQQQLQAMNAQIESIKPKKGATEEDKAAYQQAKDARKAFINDTYKPLKMEFDKRKGAIEQMQLQQQTALETEAAAGQQAAKLPLSSDLGREMYRQEDQFFAQPFQLSDTSRLMNDYDVMRNQVAALEQQLAAGPDVNTQAQLMQQRQQLMGRMQEMGAAIDQRGGTTATEAEFTKQLAAAEKERLRLLEIGDFDAAAKQAAKVQQMQARLPHFQELKTFREQVGQTRELFAPEDLAQSDTTADQKVSYVSPTGKPIEPFAAKPSEAAAVEAEKPSLKAPIIDIFDPGNILRTAINSGDTKTINDMTAHAERVSTRKTLDEKAAERKQLVDVLESRLDLGGEERATTEKGPGTGEQLRSVKRERADLFSKQYDAKQQALFKNGTYPDRELQALYDKGGAAAVEYENVMREVEELSKKVTTKQRNAKKSLIEQLIDLAKQHEELTAQMESGVATPTMGEKTAALQAKLGKGEAPAARQMDAAERYQLQRKIDAVLQKYRLIEGQIIPVRDQILKLYDSLYVTTPLEKPSKIAAAKKAEAEAEARKPKAVSRTAKTAARLAKGDVRKEAETSEKMRNLARDLGMEEDEYKTFEKGMLKRREALINKYGKYDPAVTAFQTQMAKDLTDKAIALGRKTPEYKATLKEQIAYFQEVLPTAGKQEVPTKRTGQVTRKQSAAPKRLVSSSPESKTASAREQEAYTKYRGSLADVREALASEKEGREEERFARGVEVESPDLTDEQVRNLENNKLTTVLHSIAEDPNADKLNRAVAKRLATLLSGTDVVLEDKLVYDGKEVLGSAISTKIELSRNGGLSQEVLLHEATHAVSERVIQQYEKDPSKLSETQRIAVRELMAIHARIKDDPRITSANAKGSLSEFVAEVLSNKKLQEQLREKPWKMSDMLRAIKSIILRLMGFNSADVETMLGASITAVDALMIPSSLKGFGRETVRTRRLSAKDIAALHTGSNSMKQFADQFGDYIKQKDRTPEDVERIADQVIADLGKDLDKTLSVPTADTLDYRALATMSDGKIYDNDNPLHYIEAEPATHAAVEALSNPDLRRQEARVIAKQRKEDFLSLAQYFSDNYTNYTIAEVALVLKAASKYAVLSSKDGTLRLAELANNNRHSVAVVGKDGADAVIEELRRGKNLKTAFLDGLQRTADANAKKNERLNGWKKFDQASPTKEAYTREEAEQARAAGRTTPLPKYKPSSEEAAADLNAGCAGTSWCTGASVQTARGQIEGGDFYVYYKDGKPDVAVRMNGKDQIGEIRGNTPNQALTKEQQKTAEEFLLGSKFKGADKYVGETARKALLIKLFSDPNFNDYKELTALGEFVRNGQLRDYKVRGMLDFSAFGGYGRGQPSAAVIEALNKRLKAVVHKAFETNNFVGQDLRFNDRALSEDVEFDGKKYPVDLATLESANDVTFDYNTDAPYVAPKLKSVGNLSVSPGAVVAPNLTDVGELTLFGTRARLTELTVSPDAVIKKIDPYSAYGQFVVHGAKTVNEVVEPKGTAELSLPDAKYVRVAVMQGDEMLEASTSKLTDYLRDKIRDADSNAGYGIVREPVTELSLEAKKAFKKVVRDIAAVLGMRNFNIESESYYDDDGSPKTLLNKFMDEYAGDYVRADMLAFNKKANEALGLTGSDTLTFETGVVNTPSKIADTPPVEQLTEAPEVPRFAPKDVGVQEEKKGVFSFKQARQPSNSVVGQKPSALDTFLGNVLGLPGRVQFVDQYAALSEALKKGKDAGQISSLEATNANYLLRFGQQVSQFAGQFLTNGRVKLEVTKKDGGVESVYRSVGGVNLSNVAEALSKAGLGNATAQENMFTVYLAGQRAKQVGWNKLNFSDPAKAQAEFNSVMDQLNGNQAAKDAFEAAAKLYQQYNAGLLDFLVETGALTAKKAAELKNITYVPFYRVKDGEVQLMIDKEHHVTINNIKDEPQLQQLVGDDTSIMPVFTSAVQNTFMLTNMALRNQAVKETAFTLRKLGIASRVAPGKGPAGADVVRFKKNGEDHYAVIDTDLYGVPAHLIVRGMEGIKTSMPAVIRMLGMPANLLRAFVVRNPTYAIRQVVRDPLNAWLTTGTDAVPVLSSMKELASMVAGRSEAERKLMESGAISSNVFAGNEQDMAKFLKDISVGKSGWDKAMAKLDAFAMQGDAATRAVVYKDSLAKGMTEQEALLRTLESMNFSRRGVSPSMQALSIMIPFFNAQIQGLDVLYRAFKGDMPYSEQLKIREKLIARGLMLAMGTIAYAAMMEDDEAYKRAKPEERYGNWFVYVPGVKEPVRVPIPFELGYLFKALPEAVYNMAANDEKAGKALGGIGKLLAQTNPFSLPQAVKPITEVILGKSFFSGDIESEREKQTLASMRYRENSTEVAKMIGAITGQVSDKASAISIDYLIRGYTGGLGIALVSLANPLLASDQKADVAKPSMKPSQVPFIGGLFQPVEGRGTLDEAYDRMMEVRKVKGAYNKLVEEGRQADARAFAQDYASDLAAVSVSGSVQKRLGEVAKQERIIKASPTLTTEQKDERLERLDEMKVKMARQFLALTDRTTPR